MLLTRKTSTSSTASQPAQSVFVDRLQRGLSQALPTLDRRGFLRRSGLGVGVGLAATQLSLVKKADAASAGTGDGSGKIEVKRTVCSHCSVGCAVDAVVENGVWVRKSLCLIPLLTLVRIAPKAQHCANTVTASSDCATP